MFFSKWQPPLTIKLICAFGSRDAGIAGTSDSQLLKLLLMVNGFYPGGEDAPDTPKAIWKRFRKPRYTGMRSSSMSAPITSSAAMPNS